ncbi:MAG TPA: hypothetical protein VLE73_03490 [Candidatus Saccharimonadales bacterium]|nr:hypothetical protein [Candidatus Saccharimonadales bacterium]
MPNPKRRTFDDRTARLSPAFEASLPPGIRLSRRVDTRRFLSPINVFVRTGSQPEQYVVMERDAPNIERRNNLLLFGGYGPFGVAELEKYLTRTGNFIDGRGASFGMETPVLENYDAADRLTALGALILFAAQDVAGDGPIGAGVIPRVKRLDEQSGGAHACYEGVAIGVKQFSIHFGPARRSGYWCYDIELPQTNQSVPSDLRMNIVQSVNDQAARAVPDLLASAVVFAIAHRLHR